MKRKVIQLAGKTAVVSLPSKWVKKYGVLKGDEVEVEEQGHELIIRTKSVQKAQHVAVDIRNLEERAIRHVLSGLHRYGYEEIIIAYDEKNSLKVVNDLVKNTFIGFAVIEQTSKKCTLRNISSELQEEFDTALRRAFLVTLSLSKSTGEAINEKNWQG